MTVKHVVPAAEPQPHLSAVPRRERHPLVPRRGVYPDGLKRALDVLLALVFCVPALPLVLFAGLLVKLTSRGPLLYSQVRLGLGGRPFRIFKIRSMVADSEKNGACWSTPGDPRVTRAGRFLRRTHLDELPQLWNVLRGDMSLVGPRPERPEFVPTLEVAVPHYRDRLQVRPGLTGLAQVQLPPDTDLESVERKLACDLCYLQGVGFWLDLRLLLATVCYVLGWSCRWPCRVLRLPPAAGAEAAYRELTRHEGPSGRGPGKLFHEEL
jgi:lipopolysaccharide/colanic/teichoic acid biosynthesis glycosyltransferase